jgi:phosphomannomutase
VGISKDYKGAFRSAERLPLSIYGRRINFEILTLEYTMSIQFGTDGWRAVFADQFTFENVETVAQAFSDYINQQNCESKEVAISYDTRFMSSMFAYNFAEIIASNKINVYLSKHFTPTPLLSYTVKNRNLSAGVMVTASHNPYYYNGIKLKANYGGPVMSEVTNSIEKLLHRNKPQKKSNLVKGYLHLEDFSDEYKKHLFELIKVEDMKKSTRKIVVDSMGGAGSGLIDSLLKNLNVNFISINNQPNPFFNNVSPEPIPKNLSKLRQTIIINNAD